MRLYFAYGANMVPRQMARRCPGARLIGPAILPNHRFAIIRGGHGTVLRRPGSAVHGVLWRLARRNAAALDRYEEVAAGLYRREYRAVLSAGRACRALIYVAAVTARGKPRYRYIAEIIAAARRIGLPAACVTALEAFLPRVSQGSCFVISGEQE